MVAPPTSPTSLLWAHQLKREHSHLLERIKKLEGANRELHEELRGAQQRVEATERTNAEFAPLIERVSSTETCSSGLKSRLQNLEVRVEENNLQIRAQLEEVAESTRKLESGQQSLQASGNEIVLAYRSLTDVIKRFQGEKAMEQGEFGRLRRKDDPADTIVLSRRLEAMEACRNADMMTIRELVQRVKELEHTRTTQRCELRPMGQGTRAPQEEQETPFEVDSSPSLIPATPTPNMRTVRTVAILTHRTLPSPHDFKDIQAPFMQVDSAQKSSANSTKKRKAPPLFPRAASHTRRLTRAEARRRGENAISEQGFQDHIDQRQCLSRTQEIVQITDHPLQKNKKRRQIIQTDDLQPLT